MPIPPPDPTLIETLFPLERPDPPAGTFELGLVLGGTVAAGAYTAGALDALLEMLEAWHDGPHGHLISIPMVAGTSGGAMCTGMLGLLSRKRVPHITGSYAELVASDAPTGNPLWDVWVNLVDGTRFLDTGDLDGSQLLSVLNCGLIDDVAKHMVDFAATVGHDDRPYFPAPFRMAVTLANLRGVPYVLDVPEFEGWSGAAYVAHDDFTRFALPNGADPAADLENGGKRPDEFWVDPSRTGQGADYVGYDTLMAYAVASGAFPVGLEARQLQRPAAHYAYRPAVRAKRGGAVVEMPQPDWQEIEAAGDLYLFTSVDGGTFNNDPMRLVHQALAGMAGENPRAPELANRALFMIDPLVAQPRSRAVPANDLVSVISVLVGAVIDGARYLTADMVLIADKDVFSRFQLVPTRSDLQLVGDAALATACVNAFGGFFCREFRVHDFLLGRLNMRNYLRRVLILRADNKLFDGWPDPDRVRWSVDGDGKRVAVTPATAKASYYLPIIPDTQYEGTGPLLVPPDTTTLPWPWKALDPETLRKPIGDRVGAVLEALRQKELPGFFSWAASFAVDPALDALVTDKIIGAFRQSLVEQRLWK